MKPASVWTFIAVVVSLISGRAPLHAQPASDEIAVEGDDKPWNQGVSIADRQAAKTLFLEGNRLFKIPLFTQAAEQYLAALSTWKHPAFYFNLALAQLNLGQQVEARDNLEKALVHGEKALDAKRFQEAKKQRKDLEQKLGRLRVSCETQGAEVTLDGALLFIGPGNHEAWVQAKAHEITARKPDYLSEARRVPVSPGELRSLDLKLVTLSEAEDSSRRWATWKPWAVVATGVVIAAAGGVVHRLSSKNFNDYDDAFLDLPCVSMQDPKSPGCATSQIPSRLNEKLSRATQEQNIAVGSYIAGASLVAAGAVLLYLNRPRLTEKDATNPTSERVSRTR